jgi:hypothetical protein
MRRGCAVQARLGRELSSPNAVGTQAFPTLSLRPTAPRLNSTLNGCGTSTGRLCKVTRRREYAGFFPTVRMGQLTRIPAQA